MIKNLLTLLIAILCVSPLFAQPELLKDSKTGKYGFIDENGDWIIQPQYDGGEDFYEYEFTFVKKGNKWGLISQKGEVVLPFAYDKPGYGEYDEGLIPVSKAKKHGIVDKKSGTEVIPGIYDKPLRFQENFYWMDGMLILAVKEKKAGLIDRNGNVIINLVYDDSEEPFIPIESTLKAGIIQASQNKKKGLLDNKGNLLVPFQYEDINPREYPDTLLFDIKANGKYGIYSAEMKRELAPPVYDNAIFFEEGGLAIVSRKKKYGLVDQQGKEVMPCTGTFEEAYEALEKLIATPEGQ